MCTRTTSTPRKPLKVCNSFKLNVLKHFIHSNLYILHMPMTDNIKTFSANVKFHCDNSLVVQPSTNKPQTVYSFNCHHRVYTVNFCRANVRFNECVSALRNYWSMAITASFTYHNFLWKTSRRSMEHWSYLNRLFKHMFLPREIDEKFASCSISVNWFEYIFSYHFLFQMTSYALLIDFRPLSGLVLSI